MLHCLVCVSSCHVCARTTVHMAARLRRACECRLAAQLVGVACNICSGGDPVGRASTCKLWRGFAVSRDDFGRMAPKMEVAGKLPERPRVHERVEGGCHTVDCVTADSRGCLRELLQNRSRNGGILPVQKLPGKGQLSCAWRCGRSNLSRWRADDRRTAIATLRVLLAPTSQQTAIVDHGPPRRRSGRARTRCRRCQLDAFTTSCRKNQRPCA